MANNRTRVATITAPQTVGLVRRLRRLMVWCEATLLAGVSVALAAPAHMIPGLIVATGAFGVALLVMRLRVVHRLRAVLGMQPILLLADRGWVRLGGVMTPRQGAWLFDLRRPVVPYGGLLVPVVLAAVAASVLGAPAVVALALGLGALHLVAAAVLDRENQRRRVLHVLPWLGGLLAARYLADSAVAAPMGLFLLLWAVAGAWVFERPVWARVRSAPNLRRLVMTLSNQDGTEALVAGVPFVLLSLALAATWSRGGAVVFPRLPSGVAETTVVSLAVVTVVVGVIRLSRQPWLAAGLVAAGLYVVIGRSPVSAALALTVAIVAAIPREEAPAATATGASHEPAGTT